MPVLAKVIIPPDPNLWALKVPGAISSASLMQNADEGIESFKSFDKHILLLRDPRDRILSGTLFLPQERKEIYGNKRALQQVLDILIRKEQDPPSVSLLEIISTIMQKSLADVKQKIEDMIRMHHSFIFNFEQSLGEHVKWKYEDLIAGKAGKVEKYLGFNICPPPFEESKYAHVSRSKTSGDWRHWFIPEDVEFFMPLMNDYVKNFKYDLCWDLSSRPCIDPDHVSAYVNRTVKRKQAIENVNFE